MKSSIKKLGFEIEGEFSEDFRLLLDGVGEVKSDGSLRGCDTTAVGHEGKTLRALEFVSNPYTAKSLKINEILNLFEKAEKRHEFHYNPSCGFHIHYSFDNDAFLHDKKGLPVELWSVQFNNYFLGRVQSQFPEEFDARKNNLYCKIKKRDAHDIGENNDRYFAVNYMGAFDKHGTIEFRLWPSNNAKKLKKYIDFTTESINYFLENQDKLLKLKQTVPLEKGETKSLAFDSGEEVIDELERFRAGNNKNFRVGDVVRVVNLEISGGSKEYIGAFATITSVQSSGKFYGRFRNGEIYVLDREEVVKISDLLTVADLMPF